MNKAGGGRLDWLDAAKGLGIVLVVIGHVWTSGALRDDIYAFHMPFFFLVAGYVAKPAPMGEFLKRQWTAMIIPYFAFLCALMAIDPLIEHARGHWPMFPGLGAALKAMLIGGTELRGPLTIFWFVPCLMFARIAQNALSRLWPDPRDWRWAAAMAAALALGLWIGAHSDFSPLGLLSVPVALVLLWLGALWRTLEVDRWLLAVAGLASAILLATGPLAPLNMKAGDYGTPGWSLVIALLLSLGLCWLARVMPWRPLGALGRMSLVIMYCHVAVVHYCRPYFGKIELLLLAITIPVGLFYLLRQSAWGRRYFLGDRSVRP
jgi:fucose 4-O-acetylase-like acetyltransferase